MFKWVSWVIRMGATALLLSFLCIWTTGYIVNSYMESVIKQLDLPLDIQPIALSGVWGTLWGAAETPEGGASPESQQTQGNASETPAETNVLESPQSGAKQGQQEQQQDQDQVSPDPANNGNVPDSIDAGGQAEGSSPDPDQEMGVDEGETEPVFNGQEAMGQLTDEERQALYSMVVSKLNQDQLNQLSGSLKGGLTSEELTQLESMLKATLTEQEYSQMMELLQSTKKTDTGAVSE